MFAAAGAPPLVRLPLRRDSRRILSAAASHNLRSHPPAAVTSKFETAPAIPDRVAGGGKTPAPSAAKVFDETEVTPRGMRDYIERSREIVRPDGGPPRWFSPLECGDRAKGSPLLLFLPGIDGVGFGLIRHHERLGKIFDIWCLHIPVMDRTPFEGLVDYVERTVKSEKSRSQGRPIYLIGESIGACIALAVAACNPGIDLILILANPATSFSKSQLQTLSTFLDAVPEPLHVAVPYFLRVLTGNSMRFASAYVGSDLSFEESIQSLSENFSDMLPRLSFLVDILPKESFLWKLKLLRSASFFVNSRLHAVRAQTLVLARWSSIVIKMIQEGAVRKVCVMSASATLETSYTELECFSDEDVKMNEYNGSDELLPSHEEAERLSRALPNCRIRHFKDYGHTIFLEGGIDLVTTIKGAGYYRRSRQIDYVSDYLLPTPYEFQKVIEGYRWINFAASPVMLSTLENGKIVNGLAGIPAEGPVVLVGYHMLMGLELGPLVARFLDERRIHLRGIAHPFMFNKTSEQLMPDSSSFDGHRILGAVPVSAANFYKLLSRNSFVLLYPGGAREALHKKGEQYKLFWPEQSEFVRMAWRFGATIVPFGVIGEDDICEILYDYDDLVKLPFYDALNKRINEEAVRLRADFTGEVGNQELYPPGLLPKIPGRFYFLFGKPIETRGRKDLRDREKAQQLYLHVKSEVETCLAYLKAKREKDPYRNILPRLLYQATHGLTAEVPTFEL